MKAEIRKILEKEYSNVSETVVVELFHFFLTEIYEAETTSYNDGYNDGLSAEN